MLMTVNGSAPECRPQNAKRVMKYKHARTRSELQELGEDYYMQLLEAKSYLKSMSGTSAISMRTPSSSDCSVRPPR